MRIKIIPCRRFAKQSLFRQLLKIGSELWEVFKAYLSGDKEHLKEELADLATSCITTLDCQLGMTDEEIEQLFDGVNEKNRARGYHD